MLNYYVTKLLQICTRKNREVLNCPLKQHFNCVSLNVPKACVFIISFYCTSTLFQYKRENDESFLLLLILWDRFNDEKICDIYMEC